MLWRCLSQLHALLDSSRYCMYVTTCAAGVPLLHYTESYRMLEKEFRDLSSQILRLTDPRSLYDRCMFDVCAAFVPPATMLCVNELPLHRMHCEGVSQLTCLTALRGPPAETRLTVNCRLQVMSTGETTAGLRSELYGWNRVGNVSCSSALH